MLAFFLHLWGVAQTKKTNTQTATYRLKWPLGWLSENFFTLLKWQQQTAWLSLPQLLAETGEQKRRSAASWQACTCVTWLDLIDKQLLQFHSRYTCFWRCLRKHFIALHCTEVHITALHYCIALQLWVKVPYGWSSHMQKRPVRVNVYGDERLWGWTSRIGEYLILVNVLYRWTSQMDVRPSWVNIPYRWMLHMVCSPIWVNFPYW